MTGNLQVLILLVILSLPGTKNCLFSQEPSGNAFRFLFYNTGNFFDTFDDSLKDDNDFLPGGVMRWNSTRYKQKVNSVYKVIIASGGWEPPAVVGLCEVENRKVVSDLVYDTWLSKYDYGIVHYESNDPRGIDLAVIYRKGVARLLGSEAMIPDGYDESNFRTRYVLYTKWLISNDTIHLFFNHWPSRRGGVLAGEGLRRSLAEMVVERSDSIMRECGYNAKIIVTGDFNCSPDDSEMRIIAGERNHNDPGVRFTNLSLSPKGAIPGTYKYRGAWEIIDQVIVSDALLKASDRLFTEEKLTGIFSPDFLLKRDDSFAGLTPFSTYTGYRYSGGFSDHLPVYIDLMIRPAGN